MPSSGAPHAEAPEAVVFPTPPDAETTAPMPSESLDTVRRSISSARASAGAETADHALHVCPHHLPLHVIAVRKGAFVERTRDGLLHIIEPCGGPEPADRKPDVLWFTCQGTLYSGPPTGTAPFWTPPTGWSAFPPYFYPSAWGPGTGAANPDNPSPYAVPNITRMWLDTAAGAPTGPSGGGPYTYTWSIRESQLGIVASGAGTVLQFRVQEVPANSGPGSPPAGITPVVGINDCIC